MQRDAQGQALLHSVGRDVTDRRLAEQALQASQAALARTGRIAGVGGWQLDLVTNTLSWSEETRRIHEVDADFVPTLETAIDVLCARGARTGRTGGSIVRCRTARPGISNCRW